LPRSAARLAPRPTLPRERRFDDRWDDVVHQVREEVRSKLAVAHPGYDAFADDGKDKET
jgi:hypothetical protein